MELRGYAMFHCYHQQREVAVYLNGEEIHALDNEKVLGVVTGNIFDVQISHCRTGNGLGQRWSVCSIDNVPDIDATILLRYVEDTRSSRRPFGIGDLLFQGRRVQERARLERRNRCYLT